MDILFVLLGLAIFFAAAAVFSIEHFETNPAQAAVSFFIPPFAWWLYYHYWERSQKIAYTQIVAFFLILGGSVLMTWFSNTDIKILHTQTHGVTKEFDSSGYVGSDASLKDLAQAERASSSVNGRIRGIPFLFNNKTDVAEFDSLGTLRIKHGSDFFGDLEIAIELNDMPPQSEIPWKKTVRTDTVDAPTVYVSWYDNDQQMLRSLKYTSGYNLDLSLMHEEYNMFSAKIQLVLPDPEQSYVVGNMPVYNSRLRFHGEGLNKEYDSVETLEALASQNLYNTYKKYVKTVLGFQDTDYDYRSGDGLGRSTVYLQDFGNNIRRVPLIFYKNDRGWFLDVKGLQYQLKASDNILADVPSNLRQAIKIDENSIGNIQQVESSSNTNLKDEQIEITEKKEDTELFSETEKNQGASELAENSAKADFSTEQQKDSNENLKINILTEEAEISRLLLPLMNKDVELTTQAGKFKNGIYVGIHRKQIVLEVSVGGGVVEFLTDFYNMKSLRVLNSSTTKPQLVEFFNPDAP